VAKRQQRLDGRRREARGTARAQLLDAAERLLAERGYHATSVDLVAREAGVSKGAFYWNFDSKEALFLGLLEDRFDSRARGLMALTASAPSDAATADRVGRGFDDMVEANRRLVLLMTEFWTLAVRDESLRERWLSRQRELRADLAEALEARHETTGVALTMEPERLAAGIIALADGLAMDRVAEPGAIGRGLLAEMLSLIYDGLVLRAQHAKRE